jgi:TatD DNase family protein
MIDSHCHLDSREYGKNLDEIIDDALTAGVKIMVNIGADLQSSIRSVELAEKYECIYATVGVHPHDAKTYAEDVEKKLKELLGNDKAAAVGEIGLDYYRDLSPRRIQREIFRRQLEIAVEVKKPVVIHTRESFQETLEIIREYAGRLSGGVFHCFPGTVEDAYKVFDIGFHISVGGVITFPKAKMAEVAAAVPLEYILLETDAPYLTPAPFRGKVNRPAYIRYIRDALAKLRNISPAEVERITDNNCRKVYRLAELFEG